ncbi:universal stress protein [Echinicola jeungdonensis]|uniref:Universal stress protein n=1 Tax=Echinicola jeungdonensis TaxID=709343 RepID=A0ABV5J1E0_9BACT|nr:universal stress protein [Echinicola jeungdonensis]MDN3671062.1 universal stress protein [Echinicola jeungdonensis]
MSFFTRIMVGLDLSEMDDELIEYVSNYVKVNKKVKTIYFVHVVNDLELPDNIQKKYGDFLIPNDETIKYEMKQEVNKYPDSFNNVDIQYEVLEGSPLKQLLHWSRVKLIELIIAGKKIHESGTGIVMEKLARKSKCSILFVTEGQTSLLPSKKVLIPVDFSKRTDKIIEVVKELNHQVPDLKILGLNVVKVPHGYYKIGKSFEEFSEIMVQNEKENWEKYKNIHKLDDLEIEMHYEVNKSENIAKIIFDFAQQSDVSLIIMASKGQTEASVLLLGSVAEKLISYDYQIPLLLVKNPEDINDFFDALKKV